MPLVLTMMLGVVLAALGSAMVIGTTTETMIAGAYRDGTTLFYAADAAVEFAVDELARSDWRHVLDTGERSTFVDGSAADSEFFEGPDGYEVYAYGGFGEMLGRAPAEIDPYVVVWIADLTESDVDPTTSERVVGILATALGRGGGRRSIALTARLTSSDEDVTVERLSWMQE
jgi:hypothetical protein